MMMMGLHFMDEVPFKTVYIHALVRDERGQKMSKSKGNVIDPLQLIDRYGADALRFTLAAMAAQGRDIKLSTQRVEGYRNFATKLWNAARFAEMNGCATDPGFDPASAKEALNRWIAHETARAARETTEAIEAYRFNEAAGAVYRFVWNVYCDWYLELAKPVLAGPDGEAKRETRAMVAWARDEILKLLHPFMPFVTEELWRVTAPVSLQDVAFESEPFSFPSPRVGEGGEGGKSARPAQDTPTPALRADPPHKSLRPGARKRGPGGEGGRATLLALSSWPSLTGLDDPEAEAEIGWLVDLVTAIRSVRAEMNVPAGAQIPLVLAAASAEAKGRAEHWAEFAKRLARLSDISFAPTPPPGAVQVVVRGETAALPLEGVVDLAAERARLEKELAKVDADIRRIEAKLGNEDFVSRAPEEVVELERERREEADARRTKIVEALARLKALM
jgi:valyl-tRNA synthetase